MSPKRIPWATNWSCETSGRGAAEGTRGENSALPDEGVTYGSAKKLLYSQQSQCYMENETQLIHTQERYP